VLRSLVLAALIVGWHEIIGVVTSWLELALLPHTKDILHRANVTGMASYVVLMAFPFVRGAEIGFTLLTAMVGACAFDPSGDGDQLDDCLLGWASIAIDAVAKRSFGAGAQGRGRVCAGRVGNDG
jgi:hypothetical protein